MIEAVGWENYGVFFGKCADLLKSNGLMVLQAITIRDQDYDHAKRSVDFIKRYIFPGGCLPSVAAMTSVAQRFTDLQLIHLQDIGRHYAHTLRAWRSRFESNLDQIVRLGYDRRFTRLWRFYLCYCEAGFLERAVSDVHALFAKPNYRRELGATVL